jgi:hypothetical protein
MKCGYRGALSATDCIAPDRQPIAGRLASLTKLCRRPRKNQVLHAGGGGKIRTLHYADDGLGVAACLYGDRELAG